MELHRAVPNLTVADLESAIASFRAVLPLDVLMETGWIATLGTAGGAQLSFITRDATAAVNPDASVEVDDVEAAYRRALDAGLEIIHPLTDVRWGVRRFLFRNDDGHVINVLSHLPG